MAGSGGKAEQYLDVFGRTCSESSDLGPACQCRRGHRTEPPGAAAVGSHPLGPPREVGSHYRPGLPRCPAPKLTHHTSDHAAHASHAGSREITHHTVTSLAAARVGGVGATPSPLPPTTSSALPPSCLRHKRKSARPPLKEPGQHNASRARVCEGLLQAVH
jgi:hypothetical protein